RPEILRRRRPDDLGGRRLQTRTVAKLEQLFQPARAARQGALLLGGDLRRRQMALERVVLLFEVPQADVAAPHAPHAEDDAGYRALRFRKDPERDRLEH